VSSDTVEEILQTALWTASWANTQPWQLYAAAGNTLERLRAGFLDRHERHVPGQLDRAAPLEWPSPYKERINELIAARAAVIGVARDDPKLQQLFVDGNRRFFGAPVVVYLCMERRLDAWSLFDLGAISQSIMLAALEHGLGSIPAVQLVLYPDLVRGEMRIPEEQMLVIGIALGYPDLDEPSDRFRSSRRPYSEAVTLIDVRPSVT